MSCVRPTSSGSFASSLVVLLLATACATNPATGKRQFSLMSEEQELAIGQQQDLQIRKEMGVYNNRELQQYVTTIGMKLAQISERPNLPWHFTVVDVPAINAFALPGGYIYITRGIMPFLQDEAQLAGVLGHEIGHVNARHAAEQYSRATGAQVGLILGSIFVPGGATATQLGASGLGLWFLKYSRDDEAQADELGVRYAARGGWDPDGIPQMLTTLGRIQETNDNKGVPNWLATHPAAEDRVQRVQAAVRQAEIGATRFTTDPDGYLRRVDGIVYGDNPDQGVVRGNSFLHAGLRFALDFPSAWTVTNGSSEVVAREPGANVLMVLEPIERPQGRTMEDVALLSMQRAGFRVTNAGETSIHGLSAFVGTYQGSLQNLGRVVVRAAHIRQDRNVYLIAGIAPAELYSRAEADFSRTIDSFRSMSPAEAEEVRPNRIDLYTAPKGGTWQSIAERAGGGLAKAATLAIMNGHAIDDQPRDGERLKIVVGG
jgi:predicted Zn-dependent protease